MKLLITGGAGYIGSHTCLELLQAGYEVVVVDNLSNSKEESLQRVQELAGEEVTFYQVDLLDEKTLDEVFDKHTFNGVIHFAGLKAVGESVSLPLHYYHNNITGTLTLCQTMARHNVKNLVFSSSATVYGEPHKVPITEDFPLQPAIVHVWTIPSCLSLIQSDFSKLQSRFQQFTRGGKNLSLHFGHCVPQNSPSRKPLPSFETSAYFQ